MADSEFEQLIFLPPTNLYPKTAVDPYTLVHDLDGDSTPSPEDASALPNKPPPSHHSSCYSSPSRKSQGRVSEDCRFNSDVTSMENAGRFPLEARRRRLLPEIPKTAKQLSLADELGETVIGVCPPQFIIGGITRPLPVLKAVLCDDSSPDSDRPHSTDSGNSTAHSPDLLKSGSLNQDPGSFTPMSASSSSERMAQLELVDPTHRGLHRFVPRHHDEIEIDIGDPIYVNNEAEDLWCEGINMRTGRQGIFPSAHIVDVEYSDFDPTQPKVRRERFILGYLGSVETLAHKGNSVLCQAVKKIRSKDYTPHSCILEISDTGIRMVDRKRPTRKEVTSHDYFYSLKNVSFCAYHPRDQKYMGFITKHPSCERFACHVFIGCESTRPVAEAVGRAINRFYQKYIETAFPVEDIYIE